MLGTHATLSLEPVDMLQRVLEGVRITSAGARARGRLQLLFEVAGNSYRYSNLCANTLAVHFWLFDFAFTSVLKNVFGIVKCI